MSSSLAIVKEAKVSLEHLEKILSESKDFHLIDQIETTFYKRFVNFHDILKTIQSEILELSEKAVANMEQVWCYLLSSLKEVSKNKFQIFLKIKFKA